MSLPNAAPVRREGMKRPSERGFIESEMRLSISDNI